MSLFISLNAKSQHSFGLTHFLSVVIAIYSLHNVVNLDMSYRDLFSILNLNINFVFRFSFKDGRNIYFSLVTNIHQFIFKHINVQPIKNQRPKNSKTSITFLYQVFKFSIKRNFFQIKIGIYINRKKKSGLQNARNVSLEKNNKYTQS